jgi:hypothetical protein
MTKLARQKIKNRQRATRSAKSSFKYIFWSLAFAVIIYNLAQVLLIDEWIQLSKLPCKITDPNVNSYRLAGGSKKDSSELIGHWKIVRHVDQYKDYNMETYYSYERFQPWFEESFMTITADSIFSIEYPFRQTRRPYHIYKDSMTFDYDSLLDATTPPNAFYYEFHADSLVLISYEEDMCDGVQYYFYLRSDTIKNVQE